MVVRVLCKFIVKTCIGKRYQIVGERSIGVAQEKSRLDSVNGTGLSVNGDRDKARKVKT